MIQMMQPGQKLKHYQVQSILGFGTSGAVYLALDTILQRTVAVKVQNFMFRSEAELYEKLKVYTFCAVLNIYDCFKLDPNVFASPSVVIMELGNSANLHQYRQQKKLDENEINDIFFQIGFGLLELTMLNLIHRDIKPENIVVHVENDGQKYFKICDLGLSKAQDQATTINIGTPFYMAPELFKATTQILDYSVDIWALGAIIFELYTNVPLFFGTNIPQVQAKILGTSEQIIEQEIKTRVPNYKHCSILCKIFKQDPNQRPKIMHILQELDSNRFTCMQQRYFHNQTQQNEIIQTLQKVQNECQENNGILNQCQIVEQNKQMGIYVGNNGKNTNNQSQQQQQEQDLLYQYQQKQKQQDEELLQKQQQQEREEREREIEREREREIQLERVKEREIEREREIQLERVREREIEIQRQKQLEQQKKELEQEQEQNQVSQKQQQEPQKPEQNKNYITNQVFLRGSLKDQSLIKKVLELLEKDQNKAKQYLMDELYQKTINQIILQDFIDIINKTNN